MTEDEKWLVEQKQRLAPWCDICKGPAVWSEGRGWLHASREHPFDDRSIGADHEVTASEWWKT